MSLPIKHIQKTCLIDYPGKISTIVFLAGCNFRCGYCHNKSLIVGYEDLKNINEDEVLKYLESKKKWIDGVVITGGEPLLYDLKDFIKKIKSLGFLVKLDTNGSNPKALKSLIDNDLLDYIAMDIKGPLDKYDKITRVSVDINNIKESIKIIKKFKNYEFRTTVLPLFHTEEDIENIGKLLKDSDLFYIQQFRPRDCLDQNFEQEKQFSQKELEKFKDILKKYIKKVEIRS
ncbi:MAG: anaerobic ribonucleoside-triphosphate reductase activating protein [archaeon]